jgi:twitching motility protein PilJ
MNNSTDLIFFKDREGRYIRMNKAQATMLALEDPAEAVGKTDFELLAEDYARTTLEREQEIIATGHPVVGIEEKRTLKSGGEAWHSITCIPLITNLGRVAGTFGIIRDVTDRRRAEEVLDRNLAGFLDLVSSISDGDLTGRAGESEDTLGRIAGSVNSMLDNFTAMLAQVRTIGLAVSSNMVQILLASDQIAEGAARQTNEITNTSSAVEEMAASMNQVSRNAESTAEAARNALDTAEKGEIVRNATQAMERISASVSGTAEKIKNLAARSSEISEILALINGIASQTNLLSLNAAIEAAHAGDSGVGFAVVADEIRKLAENSSQATKDIARLVTAIQVETSEALRAMEIGMKEVTQGGALAMEARLALEDISSVVRKSAELIEEISVASEQQAGTTANVAASMQRISMISQDATGAARDTAGTIRGLTDLSERLNHAISRFKINGQPATPQKINFSAI